MSKILSTANGEFCQTCGDYIGRPIGMKRDCQKCEPHPKDKPVKVHFKSTGRDAWDFFKGDEKLFSCNKNQKTGKIYATYNGSVIVRTTPAGIKAAIDYNNA
jgi:hypothetical protein